MPIFNETKTTGKWELRKIEIVTVACILDSFTYSYIEALFVNYCI